MSPPPVSLFLFYLSWAHAPRARCRKFQLISRRKIPNSSAWNERNYYLEKKEWYLHYIRVDGHQKLRSVPSIAHGLFLRHDRHVRDTLGESKRESETHLPSRRNRIYIYQMHSRFNPISTHTFVCVHMPDAHSFFHPSHTPPLSGLSTL